MTTPRRTASAHPRRMIVGSPAWNPQATLALVTSPSIASSSPSRQIPSPSPRSLFRSSTTSRPLSTSTPFSASRRRIDYLALLRLLRVQVNRRCLLRGEHRHDRDHKTGAPVDGDRDPAVEPTQQRDRDDRRQRTTQDTRDLVPQRSTAVSEPGAEQLGDERGLWSVH